MTERFDPTIVAERLQGRWLRGPVLYHDSTGSTNDEVASLGVSGAGEGAVVVAGEQTAGRGRQRRVWHGSPSQGLMFSVLLRPELELARWPSLATMAGVAVATACRALTGAEVRTKWPNDIVHAGRKLAGILVEARAPQFAVIGIGVNVLGGTADWPDELSRTATTLQRVGGVALERETLLAAIMDSLDESYALLLDGDGALADRQRELESTLGQELTVQVGDRQVVGLAVDLTPLGQLVLQTPEGELTISSGEVQRVRAANGELPC